MRWKVDGGKKTSSRKRGEGTGNIGSRGATPNAHIDSLQHCGRSARHNRAATPVGGAPLWGTPFVNWHIHPKNSTRSRRCIPCYKNRPRTAAGACRAGHLSKRVNTHE